MFVRKRRALLRGSCSYLTFTCQTMNCLLAWVLGLCSGVCRLMQEHSSSFQTFHPSWLAQGPQGCISICYLSRGHNQKQNWDACKYFLEVFWIFDATTCLIVFMRLRSPGSEDHLPWIGHLSLPVHQGFDQAPCSNSFMSHDWASLLIWVLNCFPGAGQI